MKNERETAMKSQTVRNRMGVNHKFWDTFCENAHMERFFWGVTHHVENLPDRYTKKKSLFVAFGQKRQ